MPSSALYDRIGQSYTATRCGIALELVRFGEERLRARGARRISALVAQVDEVATSLWRTSGYLLDENVGRFVRKL
jgi:ribosomal protein S18 acetylase RimI-like enzyme